MCWLVGWQACVWSWQLVCRGRRAAAPCRAPPLTGLQLAALARGKHSFFFQFHSEMLHLTGTRTQVAW